MREERGHLAGDITITEPYTLWGSIAGDVSVSKGGKFYLRGAIYGNLHALPGGRIHVFGNISGNLTVAEKTKVDSQRHARGRCNQPRRPPVHRRIRQSARPRKNPGRRNHDRAASAYRAEVAPCLRVQKRRTDKDD